MNRIFGVFVLVIILLALVGCSGGAASPAQGERDDDMVDEYSVGVAEVSSESIMEATSEAVMENASDWVTGVIGEGIEITNVVAFGGGLIGSNSMALYYSSDGITWELTKDLTPYPFYTIFPVGGQMMVYDAGNAHLTSDGKSWSSTPREDYHMFHAAMHDGKQYVKVDSSMLYTSEEGEKFWPVRSDPNNPLTDVFFLDDSNKPTVVSKLALYNGIYYAVGEGIWTSTDLYNWTKVVKMSDLTYGGYDLLSNGSSLLMTAFYEIYAFDGVAVTRVEPIGSAYFVYDGKFCAITNRGQCSVSTDGITWEVLYAEDSTSFSVYAALVHDGKIFAYGEDGQYRYVELGE